MRGVRIALIGALTLVSAIGCRNRVAEERDELWRQSQAQQRELDRKNAELEAMRRAEQQRPVPPAPPAQPPVQPTPPKEPVREVGGQEAVEDRAAGTVTVNLPGDVFFDPGSNTLKGDAKKALDKVSAALKKDYAGKTVRVEGHTDSDPIRRSKWKSNQELSEARANAVRDYLLGKGVGGGSIMTTGHGSEKPRSDDKARNRRVEIVVLVDADAPDAGKTTPAKPETNK